MKIEKTVKLESVKLSSDEFLILDRLFNKCLKCKNDLTEMWENDKAPWAVWKQKEVLHV